eukprot:s1441_g19.t1
MGRKVMQWQDRASYGLRKLVHELSQVIMKCIAAALRVAPELRVPWHQGNSRCLRQITRIRRIRRISPRRFLELDGRSDEALTETAHHFTALRTSRTGAGKVLEVLRTARYPAWLEVKWTLTEAEGAEQASPEAEAIVSGQASVSCSSARDAEALVEKLSSSLRGAGPRLPRFSDEGGTPSKQGLLSSPSPSAPLQRTPQVKAEAESSLQFESVLSS